MVLWGKCTYHLFVTLEKTKKKQSECNQGGNIWFCWENVQKTALKQSDSVTDSNVHGNGRCTGSPRETSADPRPNKLYVQGTKEEIEGLHVQVSPHSQSGRNIGYLGKNSIRITWRKKRNN